MIIVSGRPHWRIRRILSPVSSRGPTSTRSRAAGQHDLGQGVDAEAVVCGLDVRPGGPALLADQPLELLVERRAILGRDPAARPPSGTSRWWRFLAGSGLRKSFLISSRWALSASRRSASACSSCIGLLRLFRGRAVARSRPPRRAWPVELERLLAGRRDVRHRRAIGEPGARARAWARPAPRASPASRRDRSPTRSRRPPPRPAGAARPGRVCSHEGSRNQRVERVGQRLRLCGLLGRDDGRGCEHGGRRCGFRLVGLRLGRLRLDDRLRLLDGAGFGSGAFGFSRLARRFGRRRGRLGRLGLGGRGSRVVDRAAGGLRRRRRRRPGRSRRSARRGRRPARGRRDGGAAAAGGRGEVLADGRGVAPGDRGRAVGDFGPAIDDDRGDAREQEQRRHEQPGDAARPVDDHERRVGLRAGSASAMASSRGWSWSASIDDLLRAARWPEVSIIFCHGPGREAEISGEASVDAS